MATAAPAAPAAPAVDVHAPQCAASAAVCAKNNVFALWPRLRLRTGYQYVADDPQILYVGRNDGFTLDSARIGMDGALRDTVRFRLVIETASLLGGTANTPVTPILAALRDAWVQWTVAPAFAVTVGQQFMPSDIEGMTTVAAIPFSQRSVATSGVRTGQGIAVTGLSPPRQLGVVLANPQPFVATALAGEDLAFTYSLGVSNGNGQNLQGNDNKLPAAYLRLQGSWGKWVQLGVGGRLNPRTVGVAPNLFSETDTVGFVDVTAHVAGFFSTAQGIARSTALSTLVPLGGAAGSESGMGGTVWVYADEPLGASLFGIKPGVRVSAFDPSSAFTGDELVETTIGVRWDVPGALMHDALEPLARLPLTVFLDYVILSEVGAGARDLSNNRLTALVQLDL